LKIIKPYFEILNAESIKGDEILKKIELAGRTSYKSEGNITDESAKAFVEMLIKRGHLSVLEHHFVSVKIICDRGVSHEIVRHRLASYTQESTRYCNYNKGKFNNEITVIDPIFWEKRYENEPNKLSYLWDVWWSAMDFAENAYIRLIEGGATAQEARSVLPNSLKTEIVMTANLREWRHFFTLRTAKEAHPQMREVAIPMLQAFQKLIPVVFDNILNNWEY
jgi:thymidylate synthase (FAD)